MLVLGNPLAPAALYVPITALPLGVQPVGALSNALPPVPDITVRMHPGGSVVEKSAPPAELGLPVALITRDPPPEVRLFHVYVTFVPLPDVLSALVSVVLQKSLAPWPFPFCQAK